MLFFGSKKTTTTNRQETYSANQRLLMDPTLTSRQNQVWDMASQAASQPYQAYTGQRFAGFTPDQLASFEAARQAVSAGAGTLGEAVAGTQGLLGLQLPMATTPQSQSFTAGDPRLTQAMLIGQGVLGAPLSLPGVTAKDVAARTGASGYEQYMNPYTQEVIDRTLTDIERARREAASNIRAQAATAGAFGGSRSGVAEALTNRDFGNLAATQAAGLRERGFTTALGFNQADQARELQAALANQAAGIQAGIANTQAALQAGLADRSTLAQLALANQRADLESQLANQRALLETGMFNAGQLQQGSQFLAGQDLQRQLANQTAALQAANLRLGAAGLLGQQALQQQQMGAFGADLLSRIGAQQQALDQAQRDFDYTQFLEQRQHPLLMTNFLNQILGGHRFGTTQEMSGQTNLNEKRVEKTSQGIGSVLLGAALKLAGAGLPVAGLLGGLFGGGNPSVPQGGTMVPPGGYV